MTQQTCIEWVKKLQDEKGPEWRLLFLGPGFNAMLGPDAREYVMIWQRNQAPDQIVMLSTAEQCQAWLHAVSRGRRKALARGGTRGNLRSNLRSNRRKAGRMVATVRSARPGIERAGAGSRRRDSNPRPAVYETGIRDASACVGVRTRGVEPLHECAGVRRDAPSCAGSPVKSPVTLPLLLDLFAGAGGAGEGYQRAGFHVVGVDIDPKPLRHNPHECYQGDALDVLDTLLAGREWQGYVLHDFDAIHASPPCQHYVTFLRGWNAQYYRKYPDMVALVRERLAATGLPYMLENIPTSPVRATLVLCGSSFGLRVRRHRRFEMNWLAWGLPCWHKEQGPPIGVYGNGGPQNPGGRGRRYKTKAEASHAMGGLDWMTIDEMTEAIPPAYTHWIGAQLRAALEVVA